MYHSGSGVLEPSQRMDIDPGNAGVRYSAFHLQTAVRMINRHTSANHQARNYYSSILLDDLTTTSADDRIMLNLQDATSAPQATSALATSSAPEMGPEEAQDIVNRTKADFEWWAPKIGEVCHSSGLVERRDNNHTDADYLTCRSTSNARRSRQPWMI